MSVISIHILIFLNWFSNCVVFLLVFSFCLSCLVFYPGKISPLYHPGFLFSFPFLLSYFEFQIALFVLKYFICITLSSCYILKYYLSSLQGHYVSFHDVLLFCLYWFCFLLALKLKKNTYLFWCQFSNYILLSYVTYDYSWLLFVI